MMPITATTGVYAILGDPVAHSLSPLMHNGWFADHQIDAVYVALRLTSRFDEAVRAIEAMRNLGLKGANVTVPHKGAAARAAGLGEGAAVNTLRWDEGGALCACSTDGAGFLAALDDAAPAWRARASNVLIIGAGGAAHALGETLAPIVESVLFINRTFERAWALSDLLPGTFASPWEDLETAFASANLIINTTTLGMSGGASPDWPVHACRPEAILVDIVYRPLETPLLAAARARGLHGVDGLGMLIHQGALAFEFWHGVKPDAAKARARLLAALGAAP